MRTRIFSKLFLSMTLAITLVGTQGCGGAQARKAKHMDKGAAYLAAGNYDKARVEFLNALQIAPADAEARFENGVVEEKLGKPREAAKFYQGAIDVDPEHVGARAKLARLFLFSAAPDRALDLVEPVIEKHPDDAALLTVRAAARLQKKDPAGARADAQRAVQLQPSNEDAIAVLAGIYVSAGETQNAQSLLERSITLIPGTVDLRLVLAQIYADARRDADTERLLLDLVRLQPKDPVQRLRLAQFYARNDRIDAGEQTLRDAVRIFPDDHQVKLDLIDFLAARRGRDVAEHELQALVAAAPQDFELKFALAKFYEDAQRWPDAERIYRGVIDAGKLEPAGLRARDRLAALRLQYGDMAGAAALASEVLAKSPRDDDALALRGNIAIARQDPRSAIADLRAVLRDQPNAPGILRALARAHLANGEPAVAEETLRHAVEANPKDTAVRLDFAKLLGDLGKVDQAKVILNQLAAENPDDVAVPDARFRLAMTAKDFAAAESAAKAIAGMRPKSAVGLLYQGMTAEAQHHDEQAIQLYAASLEVQPETQEPLQCLVRLLVSKKHTEEALKRLDEMALRYPNNPYFPNLKGDVLVTGSRADEAMPSYRMAIARAAKWWIPYRGLAYAQLQSNDAAGALDTLRNAMPIVDQGDSLGTELAGLLEREGRTDDAIAEYESLLQRYPSSEIVANNLAMLLANDKRDRASLDRAKALSAPFADSANPSLLDTYGWVLFKRGETSESVPILERVVKKAPEAALARYHLGMAQWQAGNLGGARDNLQRAVGSGAKFSGWDEAKATLDKLSRSPT